jgi:hypothetical protein
MRDIRDDLQDRVRMVEQQINAEHAQFQTMIAQLKREQEARLEDLTVQLRAVNGLIELTAWQHNARLAVARALALAAAVEISLTPHRSSQA